MPKTLLIVESAKKAKTIRGILGRSYTVKATGGHILDMPRNDLQIDLQTFEPTLHLSRGKGNLLTTLKKSAATADNIYLATDPDREGEAIAQHVADRLGRNLAQRTQRVTFTAITEANIRAALAQPRPIDRHLVEAQTARRVIDRLVGYLASPVLWAGLSGVKGLSAGRVQSPALWLVVERERAIRAFVPEEWWSVDAELSKKADSPPLKFWARLIDIKGEKPSLKTAQAAEAVKQALQQAAWRVETVKKGQRQRRPYPPFTTDSLQQAASSQLGLNPQLTMKVAQELYEGVDVGEGKAVGLITYLRTDSLTVDPTAQQTAREVVTHYFGADYLPPSPPKYSTRDKTAQEAHEAIRPTDPWRTPKKLEPYLTPLQHKLYRLIWRRFVASQMKPAVYDTLQVDIAPLKPPQNASMGYLFRATGSTLRFAGFLKVYGVDEDAETARSTPQKQADYQQKNQPAPDNPQMPALQAGDWLNLHQLLPKQHFTQPPARYTEAGLIGELKKRGLGRPSTYATIVETLKKRGYVQHINKRMAPSDLGFQVCELLEKHLQTVVDVDFTARMEADLDAIAAGERSRLGVVREFYEPFQAVVAQAEQAARAERQPAAKASRAQGGGGRKQSTASRASSRRGSSKGSSRKKAAKPLPQSERAGEACPTCQQGELVVRSGKYGPFLGCSRFREGCRYTEKVG